MYDSHVYSKSCKRNMAFTMWSSEQINSPGLIWRWWWRDHSSNLGLVCYIQLEQNEYWTLWKGRSLVGRDRKKMFIYTGLLDQEWTSIKCFFGLEIWMKQFFACLISWILLCIYWLIWYREKEFLFFLESSRKFFFCF